MAVLFPRDQKLAKSQFSTLVLHTRQLKEDNERNKTTLSGTESVKAVRLKSSGQSGG